MVVVVVVDELTSEYVLTRRASANLCIPAFQSSSLLPVFQSSILEIVSIQSVQTVSGTSSLPSSMLPFRKHRDSTLFTFLHPSILALPRWLATSHHITSHISQHLGCMFTLMLPCGSFAFFQLFCILAFLDQLLAVPYPHPPHVSARLFLGSPIAEYVYIHLHLISFLRSLDGWREKEIKLPLFRQFGFGGVGGVPPTLHRSPPLFPLLPSNLSSLFRRLYLTMFFMRYLNLNRRLLLSPPKKASSTRWLASKVCISDHFICICTHTSSPTSRLVHPIPPSHIPRIISRPPTMQKSSHIQTT